MRIAVVCLALLSVCRASFADNQGDDAWEFQFTPYLWLPTISGALNYAPAPSGGGPSVDVGPVDWIDLLNGAALFNGGARKGRLTVSADFVYLSLKSDRDKVVSVRDSGRIPVEPTRNIATETKFEGSSWTLAAGYALRQAEKNTLHVVGGVRYLTLDVRTSWNLALDITTPDSGVALPAEGSRKQGVELWDGILGLRGNLGLGDSRWSLPYYLDVGSGSSDLTWQALAGFSYSYGWGELMLVYRHLDYDEGSGELLKRLALSGPTLGARFRF